MSITSRRLPPLAAIVALNAPPATANAGDRGPAVRALLRGLVVGMGLGHSSGGLSPGCSCGCSDDSELLLVGHAVHPRSRGRGRGLPSVWSTQPASPSARGGGALLPCPPFALFAGPGSVLAPAHDRHGHGPARRTGGARGRGGRGQRFATPRGLVGGDDRGDLDPGRGCRPHGAVGRAARLGARRGGVSLAAAAAPDDAGRRGPCRTTGFIGPGVTGDPVDPLRREVGSTAVPWP